MVASKSISVLVVGGGPVGLSLAAELGLRGIDCLMVEKRDGSVTVPKMSQVSTRGMEYCRRWGITDEVRSAVWSREHPMDFVYLTTLTGHELARQTVPRFTEPGSIEYSPEGACHCPQIYFDPILAKRIKSFPNVSVRYSTELVSLAQDADGVTANLTDTLTGKSETIRTAFLVGCDGPGGVVRSALGIGLGGLGVVSNSINIFFRSPALSSVHDKGWARFYRAIDGTGCWSELIPIDGNELWRLTVFDENTDSEIDAGAFLSRLAGVEFDYEIKSILPWERRDAVAESYSQGRVFIAGDAAHQCSPTGGLGMHTGMGEAVNLAWKLEAVIRGWGGPLLLNSYDPECRPIAVRNVALATDSYHQIASIPANEAIALDTPKGHEARAWFTDLGPKVAKYSVSEQSKTQYCYEGSPICVADGTEDVPEVLGRFTPSARPGTRAPHGWVAEGKSILDLFGDGFTLLRFGAEAPDADGLTSAAENRGLPFAIADIDDPEIAALYERKLVLVRPDGHVAWRGDAAPADPLALIDRVRGA